METDFLTSAFMEARGRLHGFAARLLRDDEDAADALQDAYLRLRCRGDISSDLEARRKLAAVIRNLCIDRLRQRRTVSLDQATLPDLAASEDTARDTAELERELRKGLSELQRRVLTLIVDEGLEYAEAAQRLGMSTEAVRMNMSRARAKIRETYKRLNR